MANFLHDMMQDAMATGMRTSALRPLLGLSAIIAGAVAASSVIDIPVWATGALVCLLCILVTASLCAYGFLLSRNPDSLRMEKIKMYRIAVEPSRVGDSIHGLMTPDEAQKKLLEETAVSMEGKTR